MTEARDRTPDGRYSWLVAVVGAVAMVFTFGTVFSYGVFLGPFSETFDISRVVLSTVFSVMLFTFFIGAGAVGVLAVRFRARAVLLVCAGATGVIAPALYVTDSYVGLTVVFSILGLALGTVFVVLASIIPRWFEAHRGAATGLIFAGNGLGLFLLPPLWQYGIERFGVQDSFLAIVSVTAVAFLLAGAVCKRPHWATQSTVTARGLLEWALRLAGTRTFQLLFVGIGLTFAWYQLLAAYAIDLFTARGLTEAGGSLAFGFVGGVSILSRLGSGFAADAAGVRRTFLFSLAVAAVGASLLFAPQLPVLAVAVCLLGLGLGGVATLYIPVLMETYGHEKDTAVIGIFNVAIGVFALVVPPLGTATVAETGGFSIVIVLTIGAIGGAFWTVAAGTSGR